MKQVYIFVLILISHLSFGQCLTIDETTGFGQPSKVCPGEAVTFTNPHSGAARYEWEFSDELNLESEFSVLKTLEADGLTNPEIIEDNGKYYIFVTSRNEKEFYRLHLGNSPSGPVQKTDKINVKNLNSAETIRFHKDGNIWYAFITNNKLINNIKNNSLIRLNFGSDLSNEPTIDNLGEFGILETCRSFDLVKEGGNYYCVLATYFTHKILVLNFGNSLANTPTHINTVTLPQTSPVIVRNKNNCDNTNKIYVVGYNHKIFEVNFNGNYASTPSVDNINSNLSITKPTGIAFINDPIYDAIVNDNSGKLYMVNLQNYNIKEVATNPMQLGISTMAYKGEIFVFRAVSSSKQLLLNIFSKNCVAPSFSESINPPKTYEKLGEKVVTLKVYDTNDKLIKIYKSKIEVDVNALVSQFELDKTCGLSKQFTNTSFGDHNNAQSWSWSFGDGNSSNQENPSHTYLVNGEYDVILRVVSNSGCINTSKKRIIAHDGLDVKSLFEIPNEVCIGEEFYPKDKSSFGMYGPTDDFGYYWDFGDDTYSPFQKPSKKYNRIGKYTITLKIQNEVGCTALFNKEIQVIEAPIVDFTMPTSICNNTPFTLENLTTGAIKDYKWEIEGVGQFSEKNPEINFPNAGIFSISLTASSDKCDNTVTKTINILPKPQALFLTNANPNNPLEINCNNQTVGATEYHWDFGDGAVSTEKYPTHQYSTEGKYTIQLNTKNNNGCSQKYILDVFVGIKENQGKIKEASVEGNNLSLVFENNGNTTLDSVTVFVKPIHQEKHFIGLSPNQEKIFTLDYTVTDEDLERGYICIFTNYNQKEYCINLLNKFSIEDPFPNPSTTSVLFRYLTIQTGKLNLTIQDMIGNIISQQQIYCKKGLNKLTIDTSFYNKGMYIFSFEYNGNIIIKKIVVD